MQVVTVEGDEAQRLTVQGMARKLAWELREPGTTWSEFVLPHSVCAIDTASVPVVKVTRCLIRKNCECWNQVKCINQMQLDVSFALNPTESIQTTPEGCYQTQHIGLKLTELLMQQAGQRPEIPPLVLVLKQLLSEQSLNEAYSCSSHAMLMKSV